MPHHTSVESCRDAAASQLREALAASDKWLAVVVTVEDGRLLLRRTTCDFPMADWPNAVSLLRDDFARETVPDRTPLPAGSLPSPFFGRPPVLDQDRFARPPALDQGQSQTGTMTPALQEEVHADTHVSG